MEFSRPEYWSAELFSSSGDHPNPGIEPGSPTLQADALPPEPPGKPKNTVVGSLSLLQGIFLTQELNWSLLHCRQILYQLSYALVVLYLPGPQYSDSISFSWPFALFSGFSYFDFCYSTHHGHIYWCKYFGRLYL